MLIAAAAKLPAYNVLKVRDPYRAQEAGRPRRARPWKRRW